MRHTLIVAALLGVVLAIGCNNGEPPKPDEAFLEDVRTTVEGFSARLDEVERHKDHVGPVAATRIEAIVLGAEAQIETIRDTLLPQLAEATDTEEVVLRRQRVSAALNQLAERVREAEALVEEAEAPVEEAEAEQPEARDEWEEQLAALRDRLAALRDQAATRGEPVVQRIAAEAEKVNEALRQAGARLAEHRDAPRHAVGPVAEAIDALIQDAKARLDAMVKSLEAEDKPETHEPAPAVPDTAVPDIGAPETAEPDADARDADVPEPDAPDADAPQTAEPDITEPDAPETDEPDITEPAEPAEPDTDAPDADAPETEPEDA